MRILADQNMPLVEEYFDGLGTIERFAGRDLTAEQLKETDILLVRSITKVDATMLQYANKLKFVGTATIGTDHIDQAYLAQNNIGFSSAPGCNAVAVAEYVISSLLALAQEDSFDLSQKTVGIVGVGNIGRILIEKLAALNIPYLLCDPPRREAENISSFVSHDEILERADIISYHVPLVRDGNNATMYLLDEVKINALKSGTIVINACRGEVIDNCALLKRMQLHNDLSLVLDVWENEPNIELALLPYVRVGSVHIAGHTLEGKARGTEMLYMALCQQLDIEPKHTLSDFLPSPMLQKVMLADNADETIITNLVHSVYDVRRDFGLMKAGIEQIGFDTLRKSYPGRREFSTVQVHTRNHILNESLSRLGFNVIEE